MNSVGLLVSFSLGAIPEQSYICFLAGEGWHLAFGWCQLVNAEQTTGRAKSFYAAQAIHEASALTLVSWVCRRKATVFCGWLKRTQKGMDLNRESHKWPVDMKLHLNDVHQCVRWTVYRWCGRAREREREREIERERERIK